MTDAQYTSIVASLFILIVVLFQWRVIFSWSAIGLFWINYLAFIFVGVLAMPWIRPLLSQWFPVFNWMIITDEQFLWTIVLTIGGGILVLIFYQLSHLFFSQGKLVHRPSNLLRPTYPLPLGFIPQRLMLLSLGVLLIVIAYLLSNWSIVLRGLREGIIGASPATVIAARRAITNNYLFVLLIYNVMPFLGVMLWAFYRIRGSMLFGLYAILFNGCTTVALILVFQKRPLIIFLACLFLAHLWIQQSKKFGRIQDHNQLRRMEKSIISKRKLLLYGVILFLVLIVLYYAQTQIGRQGQSFVETVSTLSTVAFSRIVGRLALAVPMYVHYFPNVEPHYGFTNLGLLSRIFGFEVFLDTPRVYEYFTGDGTGSVATSAIMDFYGAFGIIGWFFGAMLLGVLLDRLDAGLNRFERNVSNIVFIIFMFVFVYYLSQASLARSLMGFGGGIFVFLWLVLKMKFVKNSLRGRVTSAVNRPVVY